MGICSDRYQLKIASIISQELRALARTLPERPLLACSRDGNSSENFTPGGIGVSRNGDLTFLGDQGE